MSKYLINRILRALLSVVMVVGVIMVMVYSFLDKESIFATDPVYSKQRVNGRESCSSGKTSAIWTMFLSLIT